MEEFICLRLAVVEMKDELEYRSRNPRLSHRPSRPA